MAESTHTLFSLCLSEPPQNRTDNGSFVTVLSSSQSFFSVASFPFFFFLQKVRSVTCMIASYIDGIEASLSRRAQWAAVELEITCNWALLRPIIPGFGNQRLDITRVLGLASKRNRPVFFRCNQCWKKYSVF